MKNFLLKTWLILVCLIVGSASAWAKTYTKVTDASTLKAGDVIILACDTKNVYAGPMGDNTYFSSVSDRTDAIEITLGGNTGNWTLTTTEGTIQAIKAKELIKANGTSTWTITIENGNATIANTKTSCGSILYNASSPRFCNYASGQTAIQIYKVGEGEETGTGGTETGGSEGGNTEEGDVYTYTKKNLSEITTTDDVIVVWTTQNGSYTLTNHNGTSNAPTAVKVDIAGDKATTTATNVNWKLDYNSTSGKITLYKADDTAKWLYTTNNNNGVRVGTNDNKTFTIQDNYLYNEGTKRYLGVYSSQDIRCYTTSTATNIADQTIAFYAKEGTGGIEQPILDPAISNFVKTQYVTHNINDGAVNVAQYLNIPNDYTGSITTSINGTQNEAQQYSCNGTEVTFYSEGKYKVDVVASAVAGKYAETKGSINFTVTRPAEYTSLAALVAAGAPTAEGTTVTVTLTDEVIKSIFKTSGGERRGIYLKASDQEVEIYCTKPIPKEWAVGGTVSGTLTNCKWQLYGNKEPYTWELCPADWSELTYTAPVDPVLYTVTISAPEHGSLVVKNGDTTITNGSKVEAETELSLEATPDVDYEFVKFVATDESGEHGITKTIWTVKGDVTFTAVFQEVLQDPSVTWDLSKYDDKVKADRDEIIWNSEQASMKATIGSSPANNYYPDVEHQDRKKTHFYKDGTFSVTPKNGITITAIKIYSTNDASTKTSLWGESEWSNAVSVTTVENIITIVPTDGKQAVSAKIAGTVGATGVKVYYTGTAIPDPDPVEYKISIEENIVGGTISFSPSTAVAGATITLKATPDDGYKFTSWSVNMAEGNETVNVTSNRFIMPEGDVVVSAIFTKQEVTPDTPEEHTIVCKDVKWIIGKDENGKNQTLSVTANGYNVLCQKNAGSSAPFFASNDYDVRVYANGSITISSDKPFTSIIFNISKQGLKRLAPITSNCGNVTDQNSGDNKVTWTSEEGVTSVTFTVGEKADYGSDGSSNAGQLDFTSIDIISATTIGDLVKYIEGLLNKEGTLDELQSIINSILRK